MTALIAFGALGIGISIDSVVQIAMFGVTAAMVSRLSASLCWLTAVVVITLVMVRRVGMRLGDREDHAPHKVWGKLGFD